jgi:hypothetical protein
MRFLPALTIAVVLAGCAATESETEAALAVQSVQSGVEPRPPEVTVIPFAVTGVGTNAYTVYHGEPNGGDVTVGPHAVEILMEAQWACDTPTCDLRMILIPPSGSTSDSAVAAHEGRHVVETPMPGEWNAQLRPDGITRAKGEIRVTVFYDMAPGGYTAFM